MYLGFYCVSGFVMPLRPDGERMARQLVKTWGFFYYRTRKYRTRKPTSYECHTHGLMFNRRRFLWRFSHYVAGVGVLLVGCTPDRPSVNEQVQVPKIMTLSSSAFSPNAPIPAPYTCDGEDRSPSLQWDEPPAGTQSLALIVDDPDAPKQPFTHWVLYDLPPTTRELPADMPPDPILYSGGVQGKNDFDRYGYGGPCPPRGTHRYVFKLYALDTILDLPPGVSKTEVLQAMQGHVLAGAELIGEYSR